MRAEASVGDGIAVDCGPVRQCAGQRRLVAADGEKQAAWCVELRGGIPPAPDLVLVAATAVEHAAFDVARCATEAARGYLNATDLADLLVRQGVPFRDAHALAGAAVNRAIERGVELHELSGEDQRELLPQLEGDLSETLSVASVLARRDVVGGTAPARVRAEVERWRIQIAEWAEGYHELDDLDPDEELEGDVDGDAGAPSDA